MNRLQKLAGLKEIKVNDPTEVPLIEKIEKLYNAIDTKIREEASYYGSRPNSRADEEEFSNFKYMHTEWISLEDNYMIEDILSNPSEFNDNELQEAYDALVKFQEEEIP